MGGTNNYRTDIHEEQQRAQKAAGQSAFQYTQTVKQSVPQKQWKAHVTLEPLGVKVRESCDLPPYHPESRAYMIVFDVTGSMGEYPKIMRSELPKLMDGLYAKGVKDPQVCFGAVGDAWSDQIPLQIGQFESDNTADQHLDNTFLEGGGGSNHHESYDLAAYFAAYHTSIDCFNKRGVKGVFITIGDELYYNEVNPEHVARVVGDNLEAPIPIKTLVQDVQKTFEWFHILANRPVGYGTRNLEAWEDLLGPERVVVLDDPKDICEVITKIILGHEAGLSANRVNPPEEASAAPQSGTKRI